MSNSKARDAYSGIRKKKHHSDPEHSSAFREKTEKKEKIDLDVQLEIAEGELNHQFTQSDPFPIPICRSTKTNSPGWRNCFPANPELHKSLLLGGKWQPAYY